MNLKKHLQNWLEIKEPIEPDLSGLESVVNSLNKEFWKHRQILTDTSRFPCVVCKKSIIVWPIGTERYFHLGKGGVAHYECYKELKI